MTSITGDNALRMRHKFVHGDDLTFDEYHDVKAEAGVI